MSEHEVWLVRHGQTEWSRDGKHTSTTDLRLLPEGEDVARGLADRLAAEEFALVLTSPRLRARRTAVLAGFVDAEPTEDLTEWASGDYVTLGGDVTSATVVVAGRRRGETAIGYRDSSEARNAELAYGVRVNPPKSLVLTPDAADRVVVLAED
jgi:hypothetical protein